ncbi:MAG: HAMP domain-containing protein [Proteobacteria bacterium]|nr:HAMP domain-containing protein [Pseudomonadota bacterium]
MTQAENKKPLEKLLEVARAIAHGDFSQEAEVDTSGIIAQLAKELNNTVRHLRSAAPTFAETTDQTPVLANTTENVLQLMSDSTKTILDASDDIVNACEKIEQDQSSVEERIDLAEIKKIKEKTFDIIAAQSYQDTARQKLESMEQSLEKIRNAMVEALIVMHIRSSDNANDLKNKQQIIKEVTEGNNEEKKQDLVDELLAEFGL